MLPSEVFKKNGITIEDAKGITRGTCYGIIERLRRHYEKSPGLFLNNSPEYEKFCNESLEFDYEAAQAKAVLARKRRERLNLSN